MVNFNDPGVMAQDYRAYTLLTILCGPGSPSSPLTVASVKLWHTLGGLYMWVSGRTNPEFLGFMPNSIPASWKYVTTLEYELKVFRGRIPYRRTIWVRKYMRITLLSSAISRSPTDSFFQCSIDLLPCTSVCPFGRAI